MTIDLGALIFTQKFSCIYINLNSPASSQDTRAVWFKTKQSKNSCWVCGYLTINFENFLKFSKRVKTELKFVKIDIFRSFLKRF